jgi:hypothetical protein
LNCSHCRSGNNQILTPDFACSDELAWQFGRASFGDPLPAHSDLVQVLFVLTGSFNCPLLSTPSNVSLFINGALLATNAMPLSPALCSCGNCNTVFYVLSPLFPRSVQTYLPGHDNELVVVPDTTICLSRVDLQLFYAPAIPTVAAVVPFAADTNGGSVVHLYASTTYPLMTIVAPPSTTTTTGTATTAAPAMTNSRLVSPKPPPGSFLCVFGNITAPVNVTDDGDVVCFSPSVPARTSLPLFLQHNMSTLGQALPSDPRFIFFTPIGITELRPAFGPSIGGTLVALSGSNFSAALPNVLRFGNTDVNCTFVDSRLLHCVTPPGSDAVNVTFLPNGQDAVVGTLSYQFEEVANYLYMIVAVVFVIFSVGTAVAVRVCLYRRRMHQRNRETLGAAGGAENGERAPLLAGLLDDNYLEQIDADEIQLAERIGKGTYGEVFKGVWRGTVVAVKKLPSHNITPNVLGDFLKEARIMKQLRHPNLLMMLGLCVTENHRDLAIIMEYMPRNSLWSVLHDVALALPWHTLQAMLIDTARGMTYLHTRRPPIIHRDLKSHNLLVDDAWRVKVCDFGLSRIIEANPSLNTMTACGTPCWTAPEVLRSMRYTLKADVYSFGIVAWECASRQDPFAGIPPFQVVFQVGNSGLRPEVPADCPKRIANLMRRCWHEDPAMRPPFDVVVGLLTKMQLRE